MAEQKEPTIDDESVDTSDNELEAYFDDEDAVVESEDSDTEESEEVESESEEEESPASDEDSEDTEEDDAAETDEDSEEQSDDNSDETEAEEEDTASEESEEKQDKPKKGEPDPELAKEAALRRRAERKLREAQQQRETEQLQQYLQDAADDEVELAKREREVNQYYLAKERSEVLAEKLDVSIQKAVLDLKLDRKDEAVMNFIGRRLDEFEATRVIRDQNGNILDVRGDVYQYLKDELGSIQSFRSSGAREQTKKKAKEKAAVIPKPTRTPKEKPVDEDMAAFDEEADKW